MQLISEYYLFFETHRYRSPASTMSEKSLRIVALLRENISAVTTTLCLESRGTYAPDDVVIHLGQRLNLWGQSQICEGNFGLIQRY